MLTMGGGGWIRTVVSTPGGPCAARIWTIVASNLFKPDAVPVVACGNAVVLGLDTDGV